jgi:plastocyanin
MSDARKHLPTLLMSILVAAACAGGDDADTGGADAAAGDTYTVPPGEAAVIAGVVNFDGTAPAAESIDMSEEPVCAEKHGGARVSHQPVVVNENGTLSNVFVFVREGLGDRRFAAGGDPAVMDQDGCMYAPHVMGVRTGQGVIFRNSDGLLHNINAQAEANRSFNISQPTTMDSPPRTFSRQEIMIPVRCDVHGWMEAYIGVVDHPYFAVTGDAGSFRIENLPPGDYTIEAWHERYGTQTAQVTVAAQQTGEATFTYNANMTGAFVPLGAPIDPHGHGRVATAHARGAH